MISPVEHLEMLRLRDELADLVQNATLGEEENAFLDQADRHLVAQAQTFAESISSIQDLPRLRAAEDIHAERWWWYLDVLSNVPDPVTQ